MLISPMQKDYVTSGEFGELKRYAKDGFEKTFEHIDNLETQMLTRFDVLETNMNTRFSGIDSRLNSLEGKIDTLSDQLKLLVKYVIKP